MPLTPEILRASWQSWLANDLGRRGPYWLQWVWTVLFCMVVALGFTLLAFIGSGGSGLQRSQGLGWWWHWYRTNLVVTLVIGFVIQGLFGLVARLVGHRRVQALQGWQRVTYYTGVPIVGTMIGWPVGVGLVNGGHVIRIEGEQGLGLVAGMLMLSGFITLLFYQFFESKARRIHAERRATEARLQLLQAQIEPHFLFNTLANVQSLIDHDASRAKLMLETFTDYLRASLGELRREQCTVGDELDTAETYLRLLHLRMEDRLSFSIEASEAARRVLVPPLLLQPLVENAITHGLERKVEGGTVTVRATLDAGMLRLQVDDDGLGLLAGPQPVMPEAGGTGRRSGLAVENIRQRLASRFGDAASLRLEPLSPGTRATLTLPAA